MQLVVDKPSSSQAVVNRASKGLRIALNGFPSTRSSFMVPSIAQIIHLEF